MFTCSKLMQQFLDPLSVIQVRQLDGENIFLHFIPRGKRIAAHWIKHEFTNGTKQRLCWSWIIVDRSLIQVHALIHCYDQCKLCLFELRWCCCSKACNCSNALDIVGSDVASCVASYNPLIKIRRQEKHKLNKNSIIEQAKFTKAENDAIIIQVKGHWAMFTYIQVQKSF